jgi:hypothetical protein
VSTRCTGTRAGASAPENASASAICDRSVSTGPGHRTVHEDAGAVQLLVERLAEAVHERLRRAVGCHLRDRLERSDRGDVQHRALDALRHRWGEGVAQLERQRHHDRTAYETLTLRIRRRGDRGRCCPGATAFDTDLASTSWLLRSTGGDLVDGAGRVIAWIKALA